MFAVVVEKALQDCRIVGVLRSRRPTVSLESMMEGRREELLEIRILYRLASNAMMHHTTAVIEA